MREASLDKVLTDYPFVDMIVYYVKQLGMGAIVKSEQDANNAETKRTAFTSDLYIMSVEGTADYRLYDYNEKILKRCGVEDYLIPDILKDPTKIPTDKRELCRKEMAKEYIYTYVEENNYYRKILGIPPLGKDGLYIPEDLRVENIGVDYEQPVHKMSINEIKILTDQGILEQVLNRYTDQEYEYLKYITSNIDIYKARKAANFQLLYTPTIGSEIISDKFKNRFAVNRAYTMNTIYSEAYKFDSYYYDSFITIFIIIQTMIDIISEVQEHIIKLDVFDERCVRFIFQTHGVPYYNEIPLNYQVAMMKNLHKLLKYKSTAKCMVDICSLFGFDNIKIFKYYLLRDRKVNVETGEYVFNYKTHKILDTTDELSESTKELSSFGPNKIPVQFPYEGFLDKGGAIFVDVDGVRIKDTEYEIYEGILTFNTQDFLKGKSNIQFTFYDNKSFKENINELDAYMIKTEVKYVDITSDDQKEFNIEFPKENYLTDGFGLYLSIGSTFIDPSRYTVEGNKIKFKENESWFSGQEARTLVYMFVYADSLDISCITTQYTNEDEMPKGDIVVPQPYEDYLASGNNFFSVTGSTLLDDRSYFINNNTSLTFLDDNDKLLKGRNITFHNIFTLGTPVEMVTDQQKLTVSELGKQQYEITLPFENYIENGHICEVFIDGVKLRSSEFAFFKNSIKILDQAKVMRLGANITLTFLYPKDYENVVLQNKEVSIPIDNQQKLSIPFPYDGYSATSDRWYFTVNGQLLDPSLYEVSNNTIIMKNPQNYFDKSDVVYLKFYMYPVNRYGVRIKQEHLKVRNANQKEFTINFPFFNYINSGNGFFVTVGGTLVDPSRYTVNKTTLTFTDDTELLKGRDVTCTFIYDSIYESFNNYIRTDVALYNLRTGPKIVQIPFPYDNYLLSSNNNKMSIICEDGTVLTENIEYEVMDEEVVFTDIDYVLEHGDNIFFWFSYVNAKIREEYIDDNIKNYDLKMVKIPLLDSADQYLKNVENHIPYETFTEDDWLWNNDFDPKIIKNQILEKEFAYTRTKYISIDTVNSMSKMAFDIPYFFNLFFDDVKLEERLRLQVPTIREDKSFKLAYLLCYMFSLSYEYYSLADDIQKETVPIMYILGFNFRADLEDLRQDLWKLGFYKLEFTGAEKFQKYNSTVSIKGLLNVFNNNKEVYNTIVKGMYNADNKRIYEAYKLAYKALMIREYNKKYFTIDGVNTANTYSEFLKYNDKDLYNAIMSVHNIADIEQRRLNITDRLMDAIKYIELYLESDEYKHIFSSMPGVGTDYIKIYVSKIIDFFKSYKIEVAAINTLYLFDNKYLEYCKPIDAIKYESKLKSEEWAEFADGLQYIKGQFTPKDTNNIKELVYLIRWYLKHLKLKDKYETKDIIEEIISYWVNVSKKDLSTKGVFKKELVKYILASLNFHDISTAELVDAISKIYTKSIYSENFNISEHVYITPYTDQ